MESKKRMEYGFRGYEAPALPRAMRSARGRGGGCREKTKEGNGMEYFELLATVAGELLQKQETHKSGSELQGIGPSKDCNEMLDSGFGERENSPEKALLALDRSHILANGNSMQRKGSLGEDSKLDPDDQGSSDENAIASGTSHRKLIFKEPPVKEHPEVIIQSTSASTSSIRKSDFGQSLDREKGPGLRVRTEIGNEQQLQGVCSLEGEAKLGSCRTEKERYFRNSCEGAVVTEKSLIGVAQGMLDSGGELLKVPMGLVENGEGKGENEIDEKNLGRWKTREGGCENTEDELMLDAHSLLAGSGVSGGVPMCIEMKPPPLVSSDSSGEAPLLVGSKPHDSFFNDPNNRIKVCRDDDDNSSGCTIPISCTKKKFRNPCFRGGKLGGKLRRAISSRFRKAITASSNKRKRSEMDIVTNADRIVKRETPGCGAGFTWQRTARCSPSKRRRLDDGTCILTSDAQTSTASATDLDSNRVDGEPPASAAKMRRAKSVSAGSSKHSSNKSGESHVKLGIKSFTVPELFIDMPESATVASLKRAVMEAAMNLLGGGFRVRVLLQGMVIPDESDTLLQVGISHGGKLDSVGYGGKQESLGFMLEPNPVPTSPTCAEDPLFVLSRAATQPSSRFPMGSTPGSAIVDEGNKDLAKGRCNKINGMVGADVAVAAAGQTQTDMKQWPKSEYEMTSGSSQVESGSNAGALVVHPSLGADSVQGLALVPLSHKSRGSEIGKRRIRRPFTVAEVEALVHAVEKLGTGRWRDVKLRAFDHAKHRTYVDLKDKWKTLVHTARIAPHKRRGEPVPQDLLDRVIRAHTYWTDKQAKQQAELCL